MEYIIAIVLGVLIGYVFTTIRRPKPEIAGTLKYIDEDGEPYLFLELSEDAKLLAGKKYVTMKLEDISHQ